MLPALRRLLLLWVCLLMTACLPGAHTEPPILTLPIWASPTSLADGATMVTETLARETTTGISEGREAVATPEVVLVPLPAASATSTPLPESLLLDPADWHNWPIMPIVPERARQIYAAGQLLGNNAHAFSVLGDCQSEPGAFLGVYETDAELAADLPEDLAETLAWFEGSFNRDSPTLRGGTTTGALLWPTWHQNRYTCTIYESPLSCELRIHKPAFVIIHVGTHYENQNDVYMRAILEQLIAAGVVPILATKGDNRETDEAVNLAYANLAVEYDVPVWNFWAALVSLPNHGLYTRPDVPNQGDLYLTGPAVVIHRLTALQALDVVWRSVSGR